MTTMETNKDIQGLSDEQIDVIAEPYAALGGVENYRAFARAIAATRQSAPVASVPTVAVPEGIPSFYKGDRVEVRNEFGHIYGGIITKSETRWSKDKRPHIFYQVRADGDTSSSQVVPSQILTVASPQPAAAPVAADVTASSKQAGVAMKFSAGDRVITTDSFKREGVIQRIYPDQTKPYNVVGENGTGGMYGEWELEAAHPPADAAPAEELPGMWEPADFTGGETETAPAWDVDATARLRSIVDLLGLQSCVPDGDLTGYEFAALGIVRREIERLKAKADVAPVDAKAIHAAVLAIKPDPSMTPDKRFAFNGAIHAAAAVVSKFSAQSSTAQGDALADLRLSDARAEIKYWKQKAVDAGACQGDAPPAGVEIHVAENGGWPDSNGNFVTGVIPVNIKPGEMMKAQQSACGKYTLAWKVPPVAQGDALSQAFEAGMRRANEQACKVTHGLMAERDEAFAKGRAAGIEEAARTIEDYQADQGIVTFTEQAMAIRALAAKPAE
jgi:hypothetical protein